MLAVSLNQINAGAQTAPATLPLRAFLVMSCIIGMLMQLIVGHFDSA